MSEMYDPPHPGELFGTSAELWLGMQTARDLWVERQRPRPKVRSLVG